MQLDKTVFPTLDNWLKAQDDDFRRWEVSQAGEYERFEKSKPHGIPIYFGFKPNQ